MAILNQKLVSGFTQFNSSEFNAAKHIKDGIQGFIQSCQDPAGGTFSAMPKINTLIDYSLIYKSNKRSAWDFLTGRMRHVKVIVKKSSFYFNDKKKRKDKKR